MKTVLVAINSRYEHEGLAVWYLKASCEQQNMPVTVQQYSINDNSQKVWSSILEEQPDIVAFSCYIWNRRNVLDLIGDLKKALPHSAIVVGGPEVSYEEAETDFYSAGADVVIKGEGEKKLPAVLKTIENQGVDAARELSENLNLCSDPVEYISPFCQEYLSRIKGRIAYIESSRGCPYRCSYCLSSESRGCTFFPLDKVQEDLEALVDAGAKVVKFVDRSFNINETHSLKVWDFIRKFEGRNVTFHFEINPDRLTDKQIECLFSMPKGLIQLEAGIQSVNPMSLKEVFRVMDVDQAIENLKLLVQKGNIHIHSDLIAGLPYETMESFIEAFNRVYEIKAHHLQLGFLKLIRGTRIRREAELHGYKFREYPPYEILENKYMSTFDMLRLKGVEEVLDRTYNSGRLIKTLDYLLLYFSSPFELYESLANYMKEKGLLFQPVSAERLFNNVRSFAKKIEGMDLLALDSYLILDYASSVKNTNLPDFMKDSEVETPDLRELLDPYLEGGWKKEYKKRFMIISGFFPQKKEEVFKGIRNRMLIDMAEVCPVTGRAQTKPFKSALYPYMNNV